MSIEDAGMDRGTWILLVAVSLAFFSCSTFLFNYQMGLIFQMSQVQEASFAKEEMTPDNLGCRMEVPNKPSPIEWDGLKYMALVERYP